MIQNGGNGGDDNDSDDGDDNTDTMLMMDLCVAYIRSPAAMIHV